jgi:hypothetical protein
MYARNDVCFLFRLCRSSYWIENRIKKNVGFVYDWFLFVTIRLYLFDENKKMSLTFDCLFRMFFLTKKRNLIMFQSCDVCLYVVLLRTLSIVFSILIQLDLESWNNNWLYKLFFTSIVFCIKVILVSAHTLFNVTCFCREYTFSKS